MSQFRYFNTGANEAYEGSQIRGICQSSNAELWLGGLEVRGEGWKNWLGGLQWLGRKIEPAS
jgi:hypothetical protein